MPDHGLNREQYLKSPKMSWAVPWIEVHHWNSWRIKVALFFQLATLPFKVDWSSCVCRWESDRKLGYPSWCQLPNSVYDRKLQTWRWHLFSLMQNKNNSYTQTILARVKWKNSLNIFKDHHNALTKKIIHLKFLEECFQPSQAVFEVITLSDRLPQPFWHIINVSLLLETFICISTPWCTLHMTMTSNLFPSTAIWWLKEI